MSGAAAVLAGPRLAAELRATPARLRIAAWVGVGAAVATGLDLFLQLGVFMAPMAFLFAQSRVVSWRQMTRGLAFAAAASIAATTVGGVLIQLPWLLLPSVFAFTSLLLFLMPPATHVVENLAVLPTVMVTLYLGVLAPERLAWTAGSMGVSYAIGLVLATVVNRFAQPDPPRAALAAGMAASLEAARAHLAQALRDYGRGVEAPIPIGGLSDLVTHLRHLERARAAGLTAREERAALTLLTATERAGAAADMATGLGVQRADTGYARLIDGELRQLGMALDAALAGFAAAARRLGALPPFEKGGSGGIFQSDTSPVSDEPWPDVSGERGALSRGAGNQKIPPDPPFSTGGNEWPDVRGALDALEARQLALRESGALAAVSVAEGARTGALVDALRQLVAALRRSPDELLRLATPRDAPPSSPAPPPGLARLRFHFALKVGLATTVALLIPIAAHVDSMVNLVVAPFLVAQVSYGSTIEQVWLRLAGVVIGGALSLLTMLTVMVNTDQVTIWLLWVGLVSAACAYLIAGSARVAYVATQTAVTFYVVLIALQPVVNVELVLWRLFGNLLGVSLLIAVFRMVAPDYAGRQLIGRLASLLRAVSVALPPAGAPAPPSERVDALETDVATQIADALRLVAEARFERGLSGVEASAAADAVGIAQRIAYRSVALARARRAGATAELSPADAAPFVAAGGALSSHLRHTIEVLSARDTRARPGTAADRRARLATARAAAAPCAPLDRVAQDLANHLDALRAHALDGWPAARAGALFAEVEHVRRLALLLTALDRAAMTLCVAE